MSVRPSVPLITGQPTGQGTGSGLDRQFSADSLKTLCQQISQEEQHTTISTEGSAAQPNSTNNTEQALFNQLLHIAEQSNNQSLATAAGTANCGQYEILAELRRRLATVPMPQSTPPLAINRAGLREMVAQFNADELGGLIHELFGKLDLIVENHRLLTTLQDINQFFEEHIAERLAELDDANTKLRQLNHQKDHVLGMVAHDLRGPLGNIKFAVDLLKTLQPTQDEYSHFLQMIEETTANALYLTNDLLDTAAIEAGRLTVNPQLTDLRQLVTRVRYSNSHIGAQKQINLTIELEPTIDQVLLDGLRMEQVLGNLLSNAFKYSHAGTNVILKFGRNGQDLLISVTDQGQGIPPDEIHQLFGLFARASVRPTGHEKSTGLGLAISKRIVELHGGTIGVESVVGRGATFTIMLPAAILAQPQSLPAAEQRLTPAPRAKRRAPDALNRLLRNRRNAATRRGQQTKGQNLGPERTATAVMHGAGLLHPTA